MSRYEVRKEDIKQRINALEKRRDEFYGQAGKLENELDDIREKAIKNQEGIVYFDKKGDVLDSYMAFLETQLVVEALQQHSYSIENFDLSEKDRLTMILRKGEDILFDWYVKKKQEGYEFNQIEPLHKILKEDYEDYYKQRSGNVLEN